MLAIDPSTRGFGFAVLEGPDRLIDWGVKETKVDKNRRSLKLIEDLVNDYQPHAIVVKDYAGKGSRRCERLTGLIDEIHEFAVKRKVKVKSFSRADVKNGFAESAATTKQEIAVFQSLSRVSRVSENPG